MIHSGSHSFLASPLSSFETPLRVHHVAQSCGVARRTVRWAAARGHLHGFKDPKSPKIWRFWRRDVLAYLEWRSAPQRKKKFNRPSKNRVSRPVQRRKRIVFGKRSLARATES